MFILLLILVLVEEILVVLCLYTSLIWHFVAFIQIGQHGIIIEFTDPDYNTRRNATYLPEVAAQEGEFVAFVSFLSNYHKH